MSPNISTRLAAFALLSLFCVSFCGCHSLYKRRSEEAGNLSQAAEQNSKSPIEQKTSENDLKRYGLTSEGIEEDATQTEDLRKAPVVNPSNFGGAKRPYFDWPVNQARLTRGFSAEPIRSPRSRRKRPHLGIDLAEARGSSILAAHDGTVIYVGNAFKGFGKLIVVEDDQGWATLYAHLSKAFVREGQKVLQGEKIAGMGKTGRAFGVHLHFEIRTLKGPVDPLDYLPKAALQAQKDSLARKNASIGN